MSPNGKIFLQISVKLLHLDFTVNSSEIHLESQSSKHLGTNCKPTKTVPFVFYIKNDFLNGREFMALGSLSSKNQILPGNQMTVRYEYEVCQREWWEMINLDQPEPNTVFPVLPEVSETIAQSRKVCSLSELTAGQNKTIQGWDRKLLPMLRTDTKLGIY